ncbi:glutamate-5-semialdehyde dehydrogenase [Actinoplanes sp. HUAS TT8]|uniref:glutamate-5-semialdehyde dehydrogenase n=1 Tax=Actinoplanes sp. HUAS TT8 TaxID=3447453 RepID=UPI003F51BB3A
MDATAIDECLADCRRTLGDAPPVGDPAYPRFVAAVRRILGERWEFVVAANRTDVVRGRERGLPDGMLHRMTLTDAHRDAAFALTGQLPAQIEQAAAPSRDVTGPHGTRSRRIARPLGVLLMIYESRPSVTIDGALLPVCAGNVVLLRGGSEIGATNAALAEVFEQALQEAGLPTGMVRVLNDLDRAGLRKLLARDDAIDVLIPRGSPSLTDACRSLSKIPMIVGGGGVNHLYVHTTADPDLAVRIVLDGKLHEPEGCTALETVLLDAAVAPRFWQTFKKYAGELAGSGLKLRVDADMAAALPAELTRVVAVEPRDDSDFGREFLDRTLCVSTVGDTDDAVKHVRRYGSAHTEAIVTGDDDVADHYCAQIDAAMVIVNGSVRLHDAPTLGLGSEIAISTSRLHVRGPVTLADLMSYSWRVDGAGTLRFRQT